MLFVFSDSLQRSMFSISFNVKHLVLRKNYLSSNLALRNVWFSLFSLSSWYELEKTLVPSCSLVKT